MKTYKKLFSFVEKEKIYGYFAILFSLISAILNVYAYYLIYEFLKAAILENNFNYAKEVAIKTVVFLTLSMLLYLFSGISSHLLAFRLETNLRKKGIEGLCNASFRFFDLNPSGPTRKAIDDNASQTHMIVAHLIPDNSQAFSMPILILILGFFISLRVGLIILILSILSGLLLSLMMGEKTFMEKYQKALDNLSAETVEYVRGMQVIKIFGTSLYSMKNLVKMIKDYAKYAYDYSLSCKKIYVTYQWIFFGLITILLVPISLNFSKLGPKENLVIDLVMVLFLSGLMFVAFMKIMWVSMYSFQANYAIDTLNNLYEDMGKDTLNYGEETIFEDYSIEFKNVDFAYKEKLVLKNLSFNLEGNKSYALVGSSGSGKSTIAKLISGFYKVDGGEILIGKKPIEKYKKEALIKNIAFVFQDSKLFKKSIYENVALAKENATKEEVMKALKDAGCMEILEKFKERENTIIGSKGVYLSGGEKQRLAIARAILKDSQIVIMDEASAAIDADNEYELQKAFKNLMKNKTVIMIAHRLTSIKALDEILVLEDGKIIERGSHKELMEKNGKYKILQEEYKVANDWRV